MARTRNTNSLSISTLEQMLDTHRHKLNTLQKERSKLAKKLDDMDRKIVTLSGGRSSISPRAQNAKSLVATMESALKDSGKPLPVSTIVEKVTASGYRSNSANFRALVNQTLIKDKRFTSAGRGIYQLKK
jgi:septal ring factor EnvC (AmiA/AmiB activator)